MSTPVRHKRLSDNLAEQIRAHIIENKFNPGDRHPSVAELAACFQVGYPALREALKNLETLGAVAVKHGSGIFVGEHVRSLFFLNPVFHATQPSKQTLLDLVDARETIEAQSIALATARMHHHLDSIRHAILKWNPEGEQP